MEIDMTKGKPFKLIMRFLIPVVIGNIIQQLYNLADTIIVGKYVGQDALAAVGATGTIMFLIIGFMIGMTGGFAVVTAQKFGAREGDAVRHSVVSSIFLSAIITVVLTAVSLIGMRGLLTLMNTPEDVFSMSYTYISIICGGLVFNVLYNLTSSLLRAVGNSKIPLYFLLFSAILNVFLDLLFVIVLKTEVAGAALATVISQGVSGISCLIYIFKKEKALSPLKSDWKHYKDHAKKQLMIGIPMALQFSVTAIGTVIVQGALNTLGSVVMASYTASQKIEQLVTMPFQGMGVAMATYCGQNRGVDDYKRIRLGVRESAVITAVYAVLAAVAVSFTVDMTIPIFVKEDPAPILEYAYIYFDICPKFFIPLGLIFVFRNALQGMGHSVTTLLGAAIELVSRIALAVVSVKMHSYAGVCYANATAWLSAGVLLFICYEIAITKALREKRSTQGNAA
ncbi:MAG: MATE family efflux transporter [Lachnospiraceae bacterium]|nr:MATE family efflux transporter [Lachnospiraceae bacterium]